MLGPTEHQSVKSKLNSLDPLFTVAFKPDVLGFSYFSGVLPLGFDGHLGFIVEDLLVMGIDGHLVIPELGTVARRLGLESVVSVRIELAARVPAAGDWKRRMSPSLS